MLLPFANPRTSAPVGGDPRRRRTTWFRCYSIADCGYRRLHASQPGFSLSCAWTRMPLAWRGAVPSVAENVRRGHWPVERRPPRRVVRHAASCVQLTDEIHVQDAWSRRGCAAQLGPRLRSHRARDGRTDLTRAESGPYRFRLTRGQPRRCHQRQAVH